VKREVLDTEREMKLPIVEHVRSWHKIYYIYGRLLGNYTYDNRLLLYVHAKRKLDYRHGKLNDSID